MHLNHICVQLAKAPSLCVANEKLVILCSFKKNKQPVVGLSTTALNTDFITHRRHFKVNQEFISGMELALKRHDLFNVYKKKKEKFIHSYILAYQESPLALSIYCLRHRVR